MEDNKIDSIYKLKENYILRKVADSYMIVPVGDQIANFGGVIPTNKTVASIWDLLKEGTTMDSMVSKLCELYEVDEQTAQSDLTVLMKVLMKRNMVEKA